MAVKNFRRNQSDGVESKRKGVVHSLLAVPIQIARVNGGDRKRQLGRKL
jgi:hypothetical protein